MELTAEKLQKAIMAAVNPKAYIPNDMGERLLAELQKPDPPQYRVSRELAVKMLTEYYGGGSPLPFAKQWVDDLQRALDKYLEDLIRERAEAVKAPNGKVRVEDAIHDESGYYDFPVESLVRALCGRKEA